MNITTDDIRLYAHCPKLYYKWRKNIKNIDGYTDESNTLWDIFIGCFNRHLETGKTANWKIISKYAVKLTAEWNEKKIAKNASIFHLLYKTYDSFGGLEPLAVRYPYEFTFKDVVFIKGSIPVILGRVNEYELILRSKKSNFKSLENKLAITSAVRIMKSLPRAVHIVEAPALDSKKIDKWKIFPDKEYVDRSQKEIDGLLESFAHNLDYFNELACPTCTFNHKCRP